MSGDHPLDVVGIGADGPHGLPPAIRALVETAPVLAGSREHLEPWGHLAARRIVLAGDLGAWFDAVAEALTLGPVALLASGDPLYFGIGRLVVERFGRERVRFHPQVSSVQLACSRAKLPWQEAVVVSAHGRSLEQLGEALRTSPPLVVVLTDPTHTPARIARFVRDLAPVLPYRLWVCARLGAPDEQVVCLSLGEAVAGCFAEPNIVVLERQEPEIPASLPRLGIPDDCFLTFGDRPGLITKLEVRTLALAYLQIPGAGVAWDIGSGTGAVAVELARLMSGGTVYAIEKSTAGAALIRRNAERMGVANLTLVVGRAPAALGNLPTPCRVFVGGGGPDLPAILDHCAGVLEPGGLLVANFASPEQTTAARTRLETLGMQASYTLVQISRAASLAGGTRLAPLNPVFLLRAEKPK
jgi:precorrin-6Y C5,15-methyltransferase (decarboxylating)